LKVKRRDPAAWIASELCEPGSERQEGTMPRKGLKALRGEKALKVNPMSATGMKQGQRVSEEVSRQEGVDP